MPETAMDENDRSPTRKNDVRGTWQVAPMQAKSVAHPMQKGPNRDLGLGV
jgi:hypothetical protein